jgi:hypothetical protein
MSGVVRTPLFVTVHSHAGGILNPRSLKLIEALKAKGSYTSSLLSEDSIQLLVQDRPRIALFDAERRVNRWSPMTKEDRRVPSWAKALSSKHCVALGPECRLPPHYVYSARQIINMFCRAVPEELSLTQT